VGALVVVVGRVGGGGGTAAPHCRAGRQRVRSRSPSIAHTPEACREADRGSESAHGGPEGPYGGEPGGNAFDPAGAPFIMHERGMAPVTCFIRDTVRAPYNTTSGRDCVKSLRLRLHGACMSGRGSYFVATGEDTISPASNAKCNMLPNQGAAYNNRFRVANCWRPPQVKLNQQASCTVRLGSTNWYLWLDLWNRDI